MFPHNGKLEKASIYRKIVQNHKNTVLSRSTLNRKVERERIYSS